MSTSTGTTVNINSPQKQTLNTIPFARNLSPAAQHNINFWIIEENQSNSSIFSGEIACEDQG